MSFKKNFAKFLNALGGRDPWPYMFYPVINRDELDGLKNEQRDDDKS